MPGPGSPLRMAATVAASCAAVMLVFGGLLAFYAWNENRTDGILTADHSAGLTVSPNTRLGVTAQADGLGFDIVWRIGAHPTVLSHFTAGAPVVFAPGGQAVLATTPTAVTVWWLANPARPVQVATLPGPGMAQAIASAPGHPTVAIAYRRAVVLWDLASPAAPRRLATIAATAAPNFQDQLAFSPDGRTLAAATARRTVGLWDVSTPSAPRYLATVGHDTGPLAALAFSPAAPQLAYLSQNGTVTVVDLAGPAHQAHTAPMTGITPSAGHSFAFTYSPDGTRLTAVAVGSYQLATCTWNVTSLPQPLPAACRAGHTRLDGGITFASGRTAIVGPNNHWASRGQDPLIIWPTLLG